MLKMDTHPGAIPGWGIRKRRTDMTDKELKRLKRRDLLKLLLEQSRIVEQLQTEVNQLTAQVESKDQKISQNQEIVEAVHSMTRTVETSQSATEQYLKKIQELLEKNTAAVVASCEVQKEIANSKNRGIFTRR